jgi:hypothetical protein
MPEIVLCGLPNGHHGLLRIVILSGVSSKLGGHLRGSAGKDSSSRHVTSKLAEHACSEVDKLQGQKVEKLMIG